MTTRLETPVKAFGYASGHVGFTAKRIPDGALPLAHIDTQEQRDAFEANCRLAYDNETLLVPGVPEAEDQMSGLDAFMAFRDRIDMIFARLKSAAA